MKPLKKEDIKEIGKCPKCKGFLDLLNKEPLFWCGYCKEYYQRVDDEKIICEDRLKELLEAVMGDLDEWYGGSILPEAEYRLDTAKEVIKKYFGVLIK